MIPFPLFSSFPNSSNEVGDNKYEQMAPLESTVENKQPHAKVEPNYYAFYTRNKLLKVEPTILKDGTITVFLSIWNSIGTVNINNRQVPKFYDHERKYSDHSTMKLEWSEISFLVRLLDIFTLYGIDAANTFISQHLQDTEAKNSNSTNQSVCWYHSNSIMYVGTSKSNNKKCFITFTLVSNKKSFPVSLSRMECMHLCDILKNILFVRVYYNFQKQLAWIEQRRNNYEGGLP